MADFKFDVTQAIGFMEHDVVVDFLHGDLTVFGLVCINEDNASSHGGHIVSAVDGLPTEESVSMAINEAIAAALDNNEGVEHTCKYVPVAMGFPRQLLFALTRQLYQLPVTTQMSVERGDLGEGDVGKSNPDDGGGA